MYNYRSFICTNYNRIYQNCVESYKCSVRVKSGVERMQRRFTKRLQDHCGLSHKERLACTRLITLKKRRRRADLVIAYKALHGAIAVNSRSIGVELSRSHGTVCHSKNDRNPKIL